MSFAIVVSTVYRYYDISFLQLIHSKCKELDIVLVTYNSFVSIIPRINSMMFPLLCIYVFIFSSMKWKHKIVFSIDLINWKCFTIEIFCKNYEWFSKLKLSTQSISYLFYDKRFEVLQAVTLVMIKNKILIIAKLYQIETGTINHT